MGQARQCGIVLLLTGLVYWTSFPGAFHFDDFALMLENPAVSAGSFPYSAFLDHYGGRPLTLWTFHLGYLLFGEDPLPFHLVNVLLHGMVATAFFLLLRSMQSHASLFSSQAGPRRGEPGMDPSWPCLAAALVFSLHPLQTQAVNYIWSRSMLLMALFGFISALLMRRRPWLGLLVFQMAVWSRTEALMFLPLLILANPPRWKLPAVLTGINVGMFAVGMATHAPEGIGWSHPDPFGYWISQPVAFWKYLALMIWPRGQTIDHDFRTVPLLAGLASAFALAAAFALAWKSRRRLPEGLFGLLWMAAFLLPSWLIPNTDPFNESRAYLALGGFAVMAAGIARKLSPGNGRPNLGTAAAGCLVLALFAVGTSARNSIWSDDLLIWEEAARVSPEKARVQYNLGFALAQKGRVESAEEAFQRSRRLNPNDDLSYAALGYCAEIQHRRKEAMEFYEQALQLNPRNDYAREGVERVSDVWNDLGETVPDDSRGEPSGAGSDPSGY